MTVSVTNIEDSVPIPVRKGLPLKDLEVGQSVVFPRLDRASVQSRASVIKRETGKTFTIKKLDDDTCRIWRVS